MQFKVSNACPLSWHEVSYCLGTVGRKAWAWVVASFPLRVNPAEINTNFHYCLYIIVALIINVNNKQTRVCPAATLGKVMSSGWWRRLVITHCISVWRIFTKDWWVEISSCVFCIDFFLVRTCSLFMHVCIWVSCRAWMHNWPINVHTANLVYAITLDSMPQLRHFFPDHECITHVRWYNTIHIHV